MNDVEQLVEKILSSEGQGFGAKDLESYNAKELFMDLTEKLRSVDENQQAQELHAVINLLQHVLFKITRKRSSFMESSFPLVLRKLRKESFAETPTAMDVDKCVDFVLPFIRHVPPQENEESVAQEQVIISFLLQLLTHGALNNVEMRSEWFGIGNRIVNGILACSCIEVHHILSILSWRERVHSVMEWTLGEASGEAADDTSDEFEEDYFDYEMEDVFNHEKVQKDLYHLLNISEAVYLHRSVLVNDSFYSFPREGLVSFTYWCCAVLARDRGDEEILEHPFPSILSPWYILQAVSPVAMELLRQNGAEARLKGLAIIDGVCVDSTISIARETIPQKETRTETLPEKGFDNFVKEKTSVPHWILPFLECLCYSMALFEQESSRNRCHSIVQNFISAIDDSHSERFWVLEWIIRKCAFPNVCGVLLDRLRRETIEHWKSFDVTSPFCSFHIVSFISEYLRATSDELLVDQMDIYVSALSLYRFVFLRDAENATGIQDPECSSKYLKLLHLLDGKVQSMIRDASTASAQQSLVSKQQEDRTRCAKRDSQPTYEKVNDNLAHVEFAVHEFHDQVPPSPVTRSPSACQFDLMRLFVLQAAIQSTLAAIHSCAVPKPPDRE